MRSLPNRGLALGAALAGTVFGGVSVIAPCDLHRNGVVAHGVRVGGVEIAGLQARQAHAKLAHHLLPRFNRPIFLRRGRTTWKLQARSAKVRVHIRAAVREAIARSRRDSLFTRMMRTITGSGKVDLVPRISYSKRAVRSLVDQIRRGIERPATDATVEPLSTELEKLPGSDGVTVDRALLRRRIGHVLRGGTRDRTISIPTHRVRPSVNLEELPDRNPSYIVVNRDRFELRYYRRLELADVYRIAVGQQGLETPVGLYEVQDKRIDPSWQVPDSSWAGALAGRVISPGPDNPLKARWLGFNGSAGIHGTDDVGSLGTAASHGCIRMSIPDVEQLYQLAPLHTPVYVR